MKELRVEKTVFCYKINDSVDIEVWCGNCSHNKGLRNNSAIICNFDEKQ